jgi:glycosyltransferase involved in cell wall biosynthesis
MSRVQQLPQIALVVPSLTQGGGVPAVARFLRETIERSQCFRVKLVSLSTSSSDPCSSNLARPRTLLRGATTAAGVWGGQDYVHVGAVGGELEFCRYRPRQALDAVLADCDLIQVVAGSPAWANAVVNRGKPVSLQVATRAKVERRRRDAKPGTLVDWWRKAMTCVTDKLDDRALRYVDAIQLENPWMLEYAQQINRKRSNVDIRYASPGVNTELFFPLHQRLPLLNPYILCVGRLSDPRKNIGLLLEAFYQLPQALKHVHLITAGASRPPKEYWAKVAAMGLQERVQHVDRPETADLVKLYQEASVFALSSDEEGLGVVILEAMASGIPVVATRCGGPDGIITEGVDGFLVPLDDSRAMADRLAFLCTDLERNKEMGIAARTMIEKRYADGVAGEAFISVWNKLLGKTE